MTPPDQAGTYEGIKMPRRRWATPYESGQARPLNIWE